MTIINDGLPEEIFQFLIQDFYDHENVEGKVSITSLMKPIRSIVLQERYGDSFIVNASTLFWRVFGAGVHEILAKVKLADTIQEKRYDAVLGNTIVSGKPDLTRMVEVSGEPQPILSDYKTTSVFKFIKGDFEDYITQLSGYRWLLAKNGINTSVNANIIMILRDWRSGEFDGKRPIKGYPPLPIVQVGICLLHPDQVEHDLFTTLERIELERSVPDNALVLCTPKERWWNERYQVYNRCEKYCDAHVVCNQFLESQG